MSLTRDNVELLRQQLGKRCRTLISDGRVLVGHFICVDKHKNVIIHGAEEFSNNASRFIGMVMIPGEHLVKFEMEVPSSMLACQNQDNRSNTGTGQLMTIEEQESTEHSLYS
ncbi:hypothetical protein BDF22DRAFT_681225 [Syncephalis plumigaleata]|nr:hypothetical protein BDF22DRAFT_681225 [Syncephalis plumigaleata]